MTPRERDEPVRLTRIYTRGGDAGETSLGDMSRVSKLHPLVRAYHEVLLWDIAGRQPMATVTRLADRLANPFVGKSLVLYARKPE